MAYVSQEYLLNGQFFIQVLDNKGGSPVRVESVSLDSDDSWPLSINIVVRNISPKPIYFVSGLIEFPESLKLCGSCLNELFIRVSWGPDIFWGIDRNAIDTDICFLPGELVSLNVELSVHDKDLIPIAGKHAIIYFQRAIFGDGSGWSAIVGYYEFNNPKAPPWA